MSQFDDQSPNNYLDELMDEIRNPSVLAMELRLSCINPAIWPTDDPVPWHRMESLGQKKVICIMLQTLFKVKNVE